MKCQFWQNHIIYFIQFISELYPLTKFQLLQYEDILDWSRIKSNPFIRWDKLMTDCFQKRLNLAEILPPKKVPIVFEFEGESFSEIIELGYLPAEQVYLRPCEQDNTEQKYWKDIGFGIYQKQQYNEDALMLLINTFDCAIEIGADPFCSLSIPTQFLSERKEYLNWFNFSGYWGLNWSFELLQQFDEYWDWEEIVENHTAFNYCLKDDLDDKFIEKVLSGN